MHAVSMSAWYGKSGIGLYHEIEIILLKILRESRSGSRARVAAMLPVCTMYDHLDRYKA